jgi:glutamate synthase (NADPH/NADH) small chain
MLNRKGHAVTVFEKDEAVGGLLRLGIPDFKLNKGIIERRIALLKGEGIVFKTNTEVGNELTSSDLLAGYDAVCLAVGAGKPRDLPVEGRDLSGIYFALDLLKQQNRLVAGHPIAAGNRISARGKHVLVIGGGDTGSDCVGTSIRQKAERVTQIEIMPRPPERENPDTPWPAYPLILKTSSSHMEGCERRWSLSTKRFLGQNGRLTGVEVVRVEWQRENGKTVMKETGLPEVIKADMALLCMGFVSPVHEGLLDRLGMEYDDRGNVKTTASNRSCIPKVFVAGDATLGASLVVRAIDSGRKAAAEMDVFLKG